MIIKGRGIETIGKSNSTYITKLGQSTSRLTAIWSPNWEKVPGNVSNPQVNFKIAVSGVPTYNPRAQSDIIISFQAKMQLWFYFNLVTMLFALSCES